MTACRQCEAPGVGTCHLCGQRVCAEHAPDHSLLIRWDKGAEVVRPEPKKKGKKGKVA